MDGGRLKWELDSEDVGFGVLVHEITHGYLAQRTALLQELVDRTPGLDMTLIGEGIAYAMAPGLYSELEGDNLRYNVTKDRQNKEAWEDPTYGRQRMFGLALRPLLRETLGREGTLEAFLPRARDVFLALRETMEGPPIGSRPPGPPRLAIAGPANELVRKRLLDSRFEYWIHRFNHDAGNYAEVLRQLGAGDLLVLLVAGDDPQRIPEAHAWLSPLSPAEIARRLDEGQIVARVHELHSGLRVVVLAAPTLAELRRLVRTSPLLDG